ncbi:MAG: GTP 3',8-cyclase MoaA [Deltaproteobacteria bacterium]|nr:MAG: GTP 3',8-cyclase MoaA [Deltaproteobacteria bacterium]
MLDPYGRSIEYLRLSITDRCNLRCRYCMPEEGVLPLGHAAILSYEELLRVARASVALGIRKIRVTGGEPLVRRGVVEFIARLAALPGAPEIALTTNGLLLAESAEALKAAGLRRVNVSLDTLRPERFLALTRREGLERVFAGLAAAEAAGLAPVKVNVIPLQGVNDDELLDFARLTLFHPWEVRFIEFMPISPDLESHNMTRVPMAEVERRLQELGALEPLPRSESAGPARRFRLPGARGSLGLIPAVSGHFCPECNRLRVTADGRVRGCLFGNQEVDLKPVLRGDGSDEALVALLQAAVCAKPERHVIGTPEFKAPSRRMHGIGG